MNRGYLRKQLLPHFAGRSIADIDRQDVRNWFASLRATPVAADRPLPVLSVIMREAEAMGLRPNGSNPCRGVRRYRRKGRERFLSDNEIRRLSERLKAHAHRPPHKVAAIRLLLLTGCRKSEILTLRWSDYREGHLFLRDSKTGPRTVWLSQPARNVLDGLERTSRWLFPASRVGGPRCGTWLDRTWWKIRAEAGLPDVRLHDLRHTSAISGRSPAFSRSRGTVECSITHCYTPFFHSDCIPFKRQGFRPSNLRKQSVTGVAVLVAPPVHGCRSLALTGEALKNIRLRSVARGRHRLLPR